MKSLLDRSNVDLNFAGGYCRRTALMQAIYAKDLDVIKFLLDQGIDVNAQDSWGMTALGHTTGFGSSIEVVKVPSIRIFQTATDGLRSTISHL